MLPSILPSSSLTSPPNTRSKKTKDNKRRKNKKKKKIWRYWESDPGFHSYCVRPQCDVLPLDYTTVELIGADIENYMIYNHHLLGIGISKSEKRGNRQIGVAYENKVSGSTANK